jgi:hypothetical protein
MAKKLPRQYNKLEKVLTTAGVILLGVTLIATVFGLWQNYRFISDGIDVVYYNRYLLILGGGFLVGYLVSRMKQPKAPPSFSGVVYSLFAYIIFNLLDMLRTLMANPIGTLDFPWGKIIFEGLPILVVAIVLIFALFLIRKASDTHRTLHWVVVLAFIVQQVSSLVLILALYGSVGSDGPLWANLLTIITTPLFVAVISYLLLGRVKGFLGRAFYASLIGTFFGAISLVVWEFRTNPEADATQIFSVAVFIAVIVFTALVIWRARRAIR